MASKDLNVVLGLKVENFQRGIRKAQRSMNRFANQMRSAGQSLTTNVTLPIVAIGGNAIRVAAQFESAMNQVAAVSGATGKDFKDLENLAKQLGETTSFSASQAAEGMSFLAMAGLEVNDILQSMPGVLNLAAAGQMDLAQASDIASNILTGFGKDASEMNQAVDVLAKTFTSSNTNLVQLGEAMAYVAPVAASAGLQFEEVSAAVGLLGNAGIQASMAGTSLRGAISRLLNPTSEAQKILDELGITALDASGKIRPLNEIIQMLEESGATTGQIMQLFGQYAGPGMSALVSQGSDALRSLTSELENSGGTAQKIADKQLEGLNGSLKRLQSAFEGLMITIAESGLLDAATALITDLTNAVGKLAVKFRNLSPDSQKMAVAIAAVTAAIGPLLLVVSSIVKSFSVLSGIVLSTTGVVIGVVAGLVVLYYKFDDVRRIVNAVGETFLDFIQLSFNVGKAIVSLAKSKFYALTGQTDKASAAMVEFSETIEKIPERLEDLADFNTTDTTNKINELGKHLKDVFKDAVGSVNGYLGGIGSGTTPTDMSTKAPAKSTMPSGIGLGLPDNENTGGILTRNQDLLKGYYDIYMNSIDTLMQQNENRLAQEQELLELEKQKQQAHTITNTIISATQTITDSLFNAMEQGKNVFKSLTDSIKQMVVQLIKAVAQAALFSAILSLIPGGSFVGKILGSVGLATGKGSFGANFKGMLGLASGGLVTGPTMALVGEGSGTSLSNPEVVAPLDKLRSMLSGTINNNGFVASTKLQGSDLLLVVERAERNRNR